MRIEAPTFHFPTSETNRKDFRTHLIYTECLSRFSKDLSLSCTLVPLLKRERLSDLKSKEQLIALTKKSIDDEFEIVERYKEYSTSSVIWLPIKSYYLVYHQLCAIDYILTGAPSSLSIHHGTCLYRFTQRLDASVIKFNQPFFNVVCSKTILDFKTKTGGEHLSPTASDKLKYTRILKKVGKDKENDYKVRKGYEDERNRENKAEMDKFREKLTVSVFDFFYLMRLRLNYRNTDFVDDIPAQDTKKYFLYYYRATCRFHTCFENLKNELITQLK